MSNANTIPRRVDGTVDFETMGHEADCGGYSYEAIGELAARRICSGMRTLAGGSATVRTMTHPQMVARAQATGSKFINGGTYIALPNHLIADPMQPACAKANRPTLWWMRDGAGWRVA